MRKRTLIFLIPFIGLALYALADFQGKQAIEVSPEITAEESTDGIHWMSFNELNEIAQSKKWKKNDKKVFVDLYTEWCGWCKKMDKTTFKDPRVVRYMNEHFHPIKFDAETKESINFGSETYEWKPGGRNGKNELATALGVSGYPSFAFLDENLAKIQVIPGYKDVETLMKMLVYMAEDHYKRTPYAEFEKNFDISQY